MKLTKLDGGGKTKPEKHCLRVAIEYLNKHYEAQCHEITEFMEQGNAYQIRKTAAKQLEEIRDAVLMLEDLEKRLWD